MCETVLLQVSISGQALVFVVRTSNWSLISRAGMLTYVAFFAAQVSACPPSLQPLEDVCCAGACSQKFTPAQQA